MKPTHKIRIDLQAGNPTEQLAQQVQSQIRAQRELAIRRCKLILRKQPRHVEAMKMLAMLLAQDGQLQKSLQFFDAAAKLQPDDAGLQCNRATALDQAGQLELALAGFERALALDGRLFEAHYNRGRVLLALGRLADGEAAFRQALALRPGSSDAWSSLNTLLQATGRPVEQDPAAH